MSKGYHGPISAFAKVLGSDIDYVFDLLLMYIHCLID